MTKPISPKQRRTRFIKEYLLEHNATRAAIAAGYSEKSAKVTGHRLLTNANVRSAIDAGNEKLNAKQDITVERVRGAIAQIAFHDIRKVFQDDGSLRPVSQWDDDTAAAIAGLDVNELFDGTGEKRALVGYIKKVKIASRLDALELLGRTLKMFTDKVEVGAGDELIAKLLAGRKRAAACQGAA